MPVSNGLGLAYMVCELTESTSLRSLNRLPVGLRGFCMIFGPMVPIENKGQNMTPLNGLQEYQDQIKTFQLHP